MPWWVVLLIAVAAIGLGVLAQRMGWIDVIGADRPRAGGSVAAFGSIDEVFHPSKHEAQQELVRQAVLPAPAPVPGDPGRGDIYAGKITINL